MTAHSLIVGGSIASRRVHCPASFQEGLKSPSGGSSVYADHGTAMHEATAYWLRLRVRNPNAVSIVGMTFHKHIVSQDDWDDLILPAVDALDELCETYGGGFKIVAQEKTVQVPGIPGAFGTLDVVLQSKTHTLVPDFKFGAGVNVEVEDADELNMQGLFYASGARPLFKDRQLVIAIIQPTFTPHLKHVLVPLEKLDQFETRLVDAVANALSTQPRRARGEWCRFAHCKATCMLWAGPLLDLTVLGKPPQRSVDPTDNAWGKYLAAAKNLVDSAIMFKKEIDDALIEHLRAGGKAPGFALKHAVKNRRWIDDASEVARHLKKLGFKDDEIWQRKLQTFAVVDKVAKKLGREIPEHLRPRPASTDLVLTYEGDPSTVEPQRLTEQFSAALKKLSNS